MTAPRFLRPGFPALLLALLFLAGVLPACSGDAVRDESPFAEVSGWRIEGRDLSIDLRLRNVNVEPMRVAGLDLAVRLDDGVSLFRHRETPGVEIAPGGFETLTVRTEATAAGTALLEALAGRERPNLPYVLEGTVTTEKSGALPIRREGRIYTVPGRPGEFR
ncbi:MAG: LEA type 2 family protein [Xanthomonadales bacterium]|jgi:LEA14-like dessication related protein|nr:LEA type 2 family protein [Xanthomonadales bacterium]